MWIGSLPLENCMPGNAPWLGSLDAIVVGSLSFCGVGRSFPDDPLRVPLAIATGADLSGPAPSGASAGVAVSAASTGTTGAGVAGAAGSNREAAAVVSGAGTTIAGAAAAVAAVTGRTGAGATATAGAAGEALPAETPDSIGSGGGLLAMGAGDDSTDGIGSEWVVGSTRTSPARGGSATGDAITAGAPDSIGTGGGPLATGAGDGCVDGIGSGLLVGSPRTSAAWGASTAGADTASGAMGGSEAGGAVAATGAVSAGMEGGGGCEVATGGAAGGAVAVTGAVSAGIDGGGGCEAASADGAASGGAAALAPVSVPGLAVAPGAPP